MWFAYNIFRCICSASLISCVSITCLVSFSRSFIPVLLPLSFNLQLSLSLSCFRCLSFLSSSSFIYFFFASFFSFLSLIPRFLLSCLFSLPFFLYLYFLIPTTHSQLPAFFPSSVFFSFPPLLQAILLLFPPRLSLLAFTCSCPLHSSLFLSFPFHCICCVRFCFPLRPSFSPSRLLSYFVSLIPHFPSPRFH